MYCLFITLFLWSKYYEASNSLKQVKNNTKQITEHKDLWEIVEDAQLLSKYGRFNNFFPEQSGVFISRIL